MRVWDIPITQLCNKHLVAQHHEIHCIYSIIVKDKKGFSRHPETMRWRGSRLGALVIRHNLTVNELLYRNMHHYSPMQTPFTSDWNYVQPEPWQPIEAQIQILKSKGCKCRV